MAKRVPKFAHEILRRLEVRGPQRLLALPLWAVLLELGRGDWGDWGDWGEPIDGERGDAVDVVEAGDRGDAVDVVEAGDRVDAEPHVAAVERGERGDVVETDDGDVDDEAREDDVVEGEDRVVVDEGRGNTGGGDAGERGASDDDGARDDDDGDCAWRLGDGGEAGDSGCGRLGGIVWLNCLGLLGKGDEKMVQPVEGWVL